MSTDLSAQAVLERLQRVSALAGSLRPEYRLDTKIDLSGTGVEHRLQEVSQLLQLCDALRQMGHHHDRRGK